MSEHPTSEDNGPIRVTFTDLEEAKEFDRYWQMDCGLVKLYDYADYGRQNGEAIAVPVSRIEKMEYLGWQ